MAKDEKGIFSDERFPDPEIRKKQQSPNDPSTKVKDGTNDSIDDDDDSASVNEKRNSVEEDLSSDQQVPNPAGDE